MSYDQVITLTHKQITLLVEAVGFLNDKDRNVVVENAALGVKVHRPEWNVWEVLAINEVK